MIEKKIYLLKEELFPLLNVSIGQWERRQKDLLLWFENFFDYEILKGKPLRIEITEVYGEYRPLPRKTSDYSKEEKEKDYTKFTIAALGTEFKPNSKSRVAREAICSFGNEKYGHCSTEAVAKRYIKPAFDQYGESDGVHKWVWYDTYEPLDDEEKLRWQQILSEEKISAQEAANAFYKQQQGGDITKEKMCYKNALKRILKEYTSFPVLVESWRIK